ncbi:hypothetical protein [Casimicrobium huifangae]|jgi:hypothetical protein|uniref:hypothetical protein n=1 Tax=Casimicrobium huifangae TaxID=2591109 RepID=UPI0012EBDC65|nr:hypothetical protein [Casimicrobium huifangae]
MLKKKSLMLCIAALVAGMSANVHAECKFSDGGVIQNNHLTRFNTNLTGEEPNYSKVFTDTKMAGKERQVKAIGKCDVIVYPHARTGKGHLRFKAGEDVKVEADARGVGCQCAK